MSGYVFQLLGPKHRPYPDRDEPYWFKTTGRDLPGAVLLRLEQGTDDRWVCVGMLIDTGGSPLTTSAIRDIPINKLLDDLIRQLGGGSELIWNAINTVDLAAEGGGFAMTAPYGRPRISTGRPKRGGTGPQPTDLESFAALYRVALNTNRRNPVSTVAEQLGISVGTVRNWRRKCQQKRLLDPPSEKDASAAI